MPNLLNTSAIVVLVAALGPLVASPTNAYEAGTGADASGPNSTAVGENSMATGENSTAMGQNSTASGEDSTAIGRTATAGSEKTTSIGVSAGQGATNNMGGVYVGQQAGRLSFGVYNTAVGSENTGASLQGDQNVAVGHNAQYGSNGDENVGLGAYSGQNVTGDRNTAVGSFAGSDVEGDNNTALGFYALSNQGGSNALTGSNNVALGAAANAGVAADRTTVVGTLARATGNDGVALGFGSLTSQAGGVSLGSNSVADRAAGIAGYDPSTGTASSSTDIVWSSNGAAVSVGNAATSRQLINVAAGSEDRDAVNVAQLKRVSSALTEAGINFAGDTGKVSKKLGDTVQLSGGSNITVKVTNSGDIQILISDQPTFGTVEVNSNGSGQITGVADGNVAQGSTDAVNGSQLYTATRQAGAWTLSVEGDPGVTVGEGNRSVALSGGQNIWIRRDASGTNDLTFGTNPDLTADSVTITNGGPVINVDGVDLRGNKIRNSAPGTSEQDVATVGQIPVRYIGANGSTSTSPTNVASFAGASGGPVRVTNVGPGQIAPGSLDAVNGSQLFSANQAIGSLTSEVSSNRAEANGGIASAMALSQINYDPRPGKFSMGFGLGYYGGESGMAWGMGYTTQDQEWRLSGGATYNSGSKDVGAAIAATYTFN